MINLIKTTLKDADGSLHQAELQKKVLESNECIIGDNKLKLLIPRYKDVHWLIEKVGATKRTNNIILIEKDDIAS